MVLSVPESFSLEGPLKFIDWSHTLDMECQITSRNNDSLAGFYSQLVKNAYIAEDGLCQKFEAINLSVVTVYKVDPVTQQGKLCTGTSF